MIDMGPILKRDLLKVCSKLKNNKATGSDGIPAELWKLLLRSDAALQVLLSYLNLVWRDKQIPSSWQKASVVCLFKKKVMINCPKIIDQFPYCKSPTRFLQHRYYYD